MGLQKSRRKSHFSSRPDPGMSLQFAAKLGLVDEENPEPRADRALDIPKGLTKLLAASNTALPRPECTPDILPEGFETKPQALAEDLKRARRMRRVLNRPGPTTWLNIKDRRWLANQRLLGVPTLNLNRAAVGGLAKRLEKGVSSRFPVRTLASSLHMRTVRQGLGRALQDAFADYPNADLQTVTVIYGGWSYTPAELDQVTAAKLKAQLRQHLHRVGVLNVLGPLLAVLHGEFEPTSGRYALHYHILTTAAKAAVLKGGLTEKRIKGYTATATGSTPVRRSHLCDRARQFTYLAKAYWPSRPVIEIDGKLKRVRHAQRIPEPYATQVLLWLDRQQFRDFVLMHDCWSNRKGGTAAMKRLYLFVMRAG